MSERKESQPEYVSFAKPAKTSPTAIVEVNKDGQIVYANSKAEEVLGLGESKITDRTYDDPAWKITDFEGNEFSKDQLPFQRVKDTGEPVYNIRHAIEGPNGERKLLSVNASPLFDDEGNFNGLVAMIEDITEREQREDDLETSEKRYRRFFEKAQDGMLILEADTGEIIDANPYIRDLLGFSKEELVGKQLWEIGTFQDVAENRKKFQELVEGGYIRYENLPLKTKSGKEVSVEFVSNTYMVGGEMVVQCNIRDIAEREKTKEELQESEQRFRIYVENAPMGVFLVDENGNYLEVNKAACELTGYTEEELLGMRIMDILPPKAMDSAMEAFEELLRQGEMKVETPYLKKDGTKRQMVINAVSLSEDRYLGFTLDITERKEAEQELENVTLETLQALNRTMEAKDEYTGEHINRVKELSLEVGKKVGLSEEGLEQLRYASMLHDIGKIGIPDSILGKQGELTEEEWIEMEQHPEIGERIVGQVDRLKHAAEIIGQHQEKYDGSGYPNGLEGEEITLEARIVAVADAWDAMRSDRPYRYALPEEEAIKELEENRGTQFDPEIVDLVLEMIENDEAKLGIE
jgi:PAS domain S-box-containing protein